MKTIIKYILVLIIIQSTLSSCVDETIDRTSKEAFIESITGTWLVDENTQIKLNDINITNALTGFEITINSDLSYMSNGAELNLQPFPWLSSGSFTINGALTQFTRNDGLIIEIIYDETASELYLNFLSDESTVFTGGRIQDVKTGKWEFRMKKK